MRQPAALFTEMLRRLKFSEIASKVPSKKTPVAIFDRLTLRVVRSLLDHLAHLLVGKLHL